MSKIYQILDFPLLYSLPQHIFAPGADAYISKIIYRLLSELPKSKRLLDVGCGPSSWLFKQNIKPIGLDINPSYIEKYNVVAEGYVGSSDNLPFGSQSFDGIWSIGLLHHLSKKQAQGSIKEMMRVCNKGGYVVILDAVMPTTPIKQPLSYFIRKLDRGKFMRSSKQNKELLPNPNEWKISRFTYSYTGLELMIFVYEKNLIHIQRF